MKRRAHRASSGWLRARLMPGLLALILVAVFLPTASGSPAFGAGALPQATPAQPSAEAGGASPHGQANGLNVGHAHIFPPRRLVGGKLVAGTSASSTENLRWNGGPVQHNPTFYA